MRVRLPKNREFVGRCRGARRTRPVAVALGGRHVTDDHGRRRLPGRGERAKLMAQNELVFAPLGGIGEIGMNLSIYGFGDERRRQWLIVDCGVSFAVRGAVARHRSDPAGHPLSHRAAKEHRRAGDHARPRGPYRRADRPVAAAQSAALCHAVHRRLVRGQAAVGARRAANSGQSGAARRALEPRAVHGRFHQRRPLDSGIQCAGDPHAGRHRAAYRRLEDRSDAADWRADRPGAD